MEPESLGWAAFLEGWELFRDPILCAMVAGAVLGFLGVYVVLRRMIFVSAGITQSAGLGVALSFYGEIHLGLHIEPLVGASVLALVATLLLARDWQFLRVPRDTILGLVYAFTGGAAILVGDRISQEAHDIEAILFGSAVLVRPLDLGMVLGCGAVVLLVNAVWRRGISFAVLDTETARVQGLPVQFLSAVLFVSIGLMVGVSSRALGALPVFALSVLPAAAMLVLGAHLSWAFWGAALVGAAAGALGYLLAFFGQFPVGGSQTLVTGGFLVVALAVRGLRALTRPLR